MDYVPGSVAALITGNVTPNGPKLKRRALAPVKHQPSPNVTPKSELVGDRSIYMSPTQLKKKAILKKSPKRIFESAEYEENGDVTNNNTGKVKKKLQDVLQNESNVEAEKSPKKKKKHGGDEEQVAETLSPKKKKLKQTADTVVSEDVSKKNKKKTNESAPENLEDNAPKNNLEQESGENKQNKKKNKKKGHIILETVEDNKETKRSKKHSKLSSNTLENEDSENLSDIENNSTAKSAKKSKNQKKQADADLESINKDMELVPENFKNMKKPKNKKRKSKLTEDSKSEPEGSTNRHTRKQEEQAEVNPNAITDKDSESEHESDDEIESHESGDEIITHDKADDKLSEDEEDDVKKNEKVKKSKETKTKKPFIQEDRDMELSRTLFVGNVPFSKKTKKEIKNIFDKYGPIDTVRIRTIAVKDPSTTQRLAAIKHELHPDRSTVNVYVKYRNASSVDQALVANNTKMGENYLRVSRANQTGAIHDPKMSIFVGNLPFSIEDDILRAIFVKCGAIHGVRIIRDKKTNIGKGFGYVNFESKDGVELALTLNESDLTIKNRILRVKRCTNLPPSYNRSAQKPGRQAPFKGNFQKNFRGGRNEQNANDGAARRVMNKRKFEEKSTGAPCPPQKRQRNIDQPPRDKNKRKEYVGLTAEKKKRRKGDKGMKKKKAIAEILSKL